MKIYTKTGDDGQTGLLGGQRVSKSDFHVSALGDIDELNAGLGRLISQCQTSSHDTHRTMAIPLQNIQNWLFQLGMMVADVRAKQSSANPSNHLLQLETQIDDWEAGLPPLKQFILPGGHPVAAEAHHVRCVCRRAERQVVALRDSQSSQQIENLRPVLTYLNRLSDFLFVFARQANFLAGSQETPWTGPE